MRACNRRKRGQQERSRGTPSAPKSDACDASELYFFLVLSPSSCLQSGKPRVAADVSAPPAFQSDVYGAFYFWARVLLCALMTWFAGGLNYAQWSYPRAQHCTQGTNKILKPLPTLPQQNPAQLAIPGHEHAKPRS